MSEAVTGRRWRLPDSRPHDDGHHELDLGGVPVDRRLEHPGAGFSGLEFR